MAPFFMWTWCTMKSSPCINRRYAVVCGMQKQWKGKAARTMANLAGFESLAKMAEEPWYGTPSLCFIVL